MGLKYSDTIVLHHLNQLNGERTMYSLFHLYQGKRSSQTIQDAHLFNLTAYFQSVPFITRDWIEKKINHLHQLGLIEKRNEVYVHLTEKGEKDLFERLQDTSMPLYLNGLGFHQYSVSFWERLTLLFQVTSNLVNRNSNYVPVQNNPQSQNWLKSYIGIHSMDRYSFAEVLLKEMMFSLEGDFTKPELLVMRLSGYNSIGLTLVQAANRSNLELFQFQLEFLNTLHYMMRSVLDRPDEFPLLSGLFDKEQNTSITLSTQKTYRYLQKGYTIDEISATRNLKKSTIEDHLVEMALSIKDFAIDKYVLPEKQARILKATQESKIRKLKQIKALVKDASYFEIRVVLAKYGGMNEIK